MVKILADNKVKKLAQLKGLSVKRLVLPAECPAGYLGVLQELFEAFTPLPTEAPAGGASSVKTGTEGFDTMATALTQALTNNSASMAAALEQVLHKGKVELVVPDFGKELKDHVPPLDSLYPEDTWPHTNSVRLLPFFSSYDS